MDCLLLSHPQLRDSGDYLHRIVWPGQSLGNYMSIAAIQTTHAKAFQLALTVPLLVINMTIDPLLRDIISNRKRHGLKTIYEISDDFSNFSEYLPLHKFYSNTSNQNLCKTLAQESDVVQFSSHYLQEKYNHLNKNTIVFRNQLSPKQCNRLKNKNNKKLVIGWAGSAGHYEDAKLLIDMLSSWKDIKLVQIAIMASENIIQLFRSAGIKVKSSTTGNMNKYHLFLKKLDIGIAMIDQTEFSQGRSDGKFIEYACAGVIPVCSATGPYLHSVQDRKNGILFSNALELQKKLSLLVKDRVLRNIIRMNAYNYVTTQRTHEAASIKRFEYYKLFYTTNKNSHILKGYEEIEEPYEDEFIKALEHSSIGNSSASIKILTQLLEKLPEHALLWKRLGEVSIQMGAITEGKNFIQYSDKLLKEKITKESI